MASPTTAEALRHAIHIGLVPDDLVDRILATTAAEDHEFTRDFAEQLAGIIAMHRIALQYDSRRREWTSRRQFRNSLKKIGKHANALQNTISNIHLAAAFSSSADWFESYFKAEADRGWSDNRILSYALATHREVGGEPLCYRNVNATLIRLGQELEWLARAAEAARNHPDDWPASGKGGQPVGTGLRRVTVALLGYMKSKVQPGEALIEPVEAIAVLREIFGAAGIEHRDTTDSTMRKYCEEAGLSSSNEKYSDDSEPG